MTPDLPASEKLFHGLLRAFPAQNDAERAYVEHAGARGWQTLRHLPAGTGDARLLDVGSMRGLFATAYKEIWQYGEVHLLGYDLAGGAIRRAGPDGRTYEFPAACGNIELEPWPYPNAHFDTVVCMEVIEHLIFDPVFAMNEMCRVLKPGGVALITVPNAASDECLTYLVNDLQPGFLRHYISNALVSGERTISTVYNLGHFHEYTRSDLECLARSTGFGIRSITGLQTVEPVLQSFRFGLLKTFVHALFPRSRRVRENLILALLTRESFTPLAELKDRYPVPLYRALPA